jgi:hypothetical protein
MDIASGIKTRMRDVWAAELVEDVLPSTWSGNDTHRRPSGPMKANTQQYMKEKRPGEIVKLTLPSSPGSRQSE